MVDIIKLKIFLASDHAGFLLKEKIKKHLEKNKFSFEDFGNLKLNFDDDYPDFVIPCAEKVATTKNSLGIIFGGSGQGEAIAANKVRGIRAVVFYGGNRKIISLSKEHNDANILSIGAKFISEKETVQAVDLWLKTKFSNEKRHVRRLEKIEEFEKSNYLLITTLAKSLYSQVF